MPLRVPEGRDSRDRQGRHHRHPLPTLTNVARAQPPTAASLARLTGETKTEAVRAALADRLTSLERERTGRGLTDARDDVALACAALPVRDPRDDDILGDDEAGLPT